MVEANSQTIAPAYHFSIDDVFDALIEVSDLDLPLFEHPFFALLEELHQQYDTNVDLYLFYQRELDGRLRTLDDVSARNQRAFQEASWLRLGPHALDYETPPHAQTPEEQRRTFDKIYECIERFAGPNKTSRWVRLHYFSEAYELSHYLRLRGVDTLLLTDKDVAAYRLPDAARYRLRSDGRVVFENLNCLRSHFRIENITDETTSSNELRQELDDVASHCGYLSLFTHEVELAREDVRRRTRECLDHLSSKEFRPT